MKIYTIFLHVCTMDVYFFYCSSTPIGVGDTQGSGSKDPELKKHLEAAKRAASALFSGN